MLWAVTIRKLGAVLAPAICERAKKGIAGRGNLVAEGVAEGGTASARGIAHQVRALGSCAFEQRRDVRAHVRRDVRRRRRVVERDVRAVPRGLRAHGRRDVRRLRAGLLQREGRRLRALRRGLVLGLPRRDGLRILRGRRVPAPPRPGGLRGVPAQLLPRPEPADAPHARELRLRRGLVRAVRQRDGHGVPRLPVLRRVPRRHRAAPAEEGRLRLLPEPAAEEGPRAAHPLRALRAGPLHGRLPDERLRAGLRGQALRAARQRRVLPRRRGPVLVPGERRGHVPPLRRRARAPPRGTRTFDPTSM